jgi:hypothetical protein
MRRLAGGDQSHRGLDSDIGTRETLRQEAEEFRREIADYIEEHRIPPANVHVADETGMWNGSVAARTWADPDTMDSGARRTVDHRRDTGMVALSAAGAINAQFFEHRPRKTRRVNGRTFVVQKGVAGMGTDQMKQWTQGFVERHEEDGASVLTLDRLGYHRNREVLKTLEEANIHPFLMLSQTAKLISPCTTSFFASLKARLWKLDRSITEAKKTGFLQLCDEYDVDVVRYYCAHCGWQFSKARSLIVVR